MNARIEFEKKDDSLADFVESKPRALTVRDLAGLLSVSERLVYRMASERRIPSFRICGSIRFDPLATARWLRQTMATAGPVQKPQTGKVM